jgi:NADH-ubiquinone/plastoquinone oxidoreductase chain 6
VIMLPNVEEEERRRQRLKFLVPLAIVMAAVLVAQTSFIIYTVKISPNTPTVSVSDTGLTASIGNGLFTKYLLPFEITSILLLMAIVGAMTLARRTLVLSRTARLVPGAQVLARDILSPASPEDLTPLETDSTAEAAQLLGVKRPGDREEQS